jgi:uncharacterized protein YkwD
MNATRATTAWLPSILLLLSVVAAGCGLDPNSVIVPERVPTRPESTGGTPTGQTSQPAPELDTQIAAQAASCLALGSPTGANQREMFELLNAYRVRHGLNPLAYSRTLERAADEYAERLYREDFFDHTAPDGSGPSDRALAAGFCHPYVGENIASGLNLLGTAQEGMQGFIDSPPHDANMLNPQWTYAGVGYFRTFTALGEEYRWVQLMAGDLVD